MSFSRREKIQNSERREAVEMECGTDNRELSSS